MDSLVKGGVLGGVRYAGEAPSRRFLTSTPVVVTEKTRIVAAASPNEESGDPTVDGWFLSDFYALNYLYKDQGASQTWLTAADPKVLLNRYGNYLHGNPYQERKVVLSHELIRDGQLTRPVVVKPSEMNQRFKDEIRKVAEAAVQDGGNVLLLVFCHGLKHHRFCLDNRLNDLDSSDSSGNSGNSGSLPPPEDPNDPRYFTAKDLKEAAGPHVRLTLVTTACYSGGWFVDADINATGMAASHPKKESFSWIGSNSMSRYCGSVFVSSLVGTMTSTASKLLPEGERNAPGSTGNRPKRLQPESPTEAQTMTYNAFCNSMRDVLGKRLYRNVNWQKFTFSAQDDDWEASWTERTGFELAEYEQRWNKLPTHAYEGPQGIKDNLDPSPFNTSFQTAGRGSRGLERTGGRSQQRSSRSAEMEELMARATKRRVRQLARLFEQTCPGDEGMASQNRFCAMLRRCKETGNPQFDRGSEYMHRWNLFEAVQYRIDLARLADSLVDAFHLPRPDNAECLMWNAQGPQGHWIDGFCTPSDDISNWLLPHGVPGRTPEQGPDFPRFVLFLHTALLLANKDPATTRQMAQQINAAVAEARAGCEQRLLEDPEVRQRGRDWVRSIGRRVRESLSPRKRPAPTSGPRLGLGQGESSASASSSRQEHRRSLGQEWPSLPRQGPYRLGQEPPPLSRQGPHRLGREQPASAIFASAPNVLSPPRQSPRAPFHMEAMQRALDDDGTPGRSTRPDNRSGQEGKDKGKEAEHPADNEPNFW